MRNTVALSWAALTLASIIIAGCTPHTAIATSGATPTPQPTPTTACTQPPGELVQMVFPQNGGVGVANLQGVVFAVAPNPLPTNWYVYATSINGTTAFTSSVAFLATPVPLPGSTAGTLPTPLPTPSDTPAFANPIYESASIGTFANSTKFTIFLAATDCFPGLAQSTFTTATTDLPSPTPTST